MASNSPEMAVPRAGALVAELVETLRSLPEQVRLALGRRGIVLASTAALVGFLCCLAAFAEVALSLRTTALAHEQHRALELINLDQKDRTLMRAVLAVASGMRDVEGARPAILQGWRNLRGPLEAFCAEPEEATAGVLGRAGICGAAQVLDGRLGDELAAFVPGSRPIDRDVMGNALLLAQRLNLASVTVARQADGLVRHMVEHYGLSLLILTLSTLGFVGAGVILIGLVGRLSVLYHAQWRGAQQAHDRLQETIDALPAGVVLYDAEERLVMFNSVAAAVSPQLRAPNVIGKTYEEIAKGADITFARLGTPLEGAPADWIARFRSKGDAVIRRSVDGRWYRWREVATPSGGTIGLRVDVTDLQEAKRTAEQARDRLRETIEALPAGITVYDADERLVMFNSAAATASPALKEPGAIGRTYEQIARETAVIYARLGAVHQGAVEAWISRFRSKSEAHVRQSFNGRWYEWREVATPSGGTVGLRVDVTDLQEARRTAEQARDRLRETIDALPVGILLYDRAERLVMHNATAPALSPSLRHPDAIGMTYEEHVRHAFAVAAREGRTMQPSPEYWIASFRRKASQIRQISDGRWIEFIDKAVPSGGTVAVRVDVTELQRARLAAEEARDRLQETLDASPAGILLYDRDERLVMFNAQAVDATPLLKRADVIGMTYEEVAHETAKLGGEFGAPLESAPHEWIARFRSKSQSVRQSVGGRWFEFAERATRSGGTVAFRVDVTDLKMAELAAEHARRKYEALVDSLTDTVYEVDLRRNAITFASAAAAGLFGLPPSALIGKSLLEHVLPEDRERIEEAVRRARRAPDSVQEIQYRLIAADGTVRHVEDRFRRSADRDAVSGVLRDVSERVRLTGRLEEETARLRAIVESSGAHISLVDMDLRLLMTNREIRRFHGMENTELVGKTLDEAFGTPCTLDPELLAKWRSEPLDAQELVPHRYGKEIVDCGGRRRIFTISATPIVDSDRRVRQIAFLGVDDTERVEAEQALLEAERRARDFLQETIDALPAGVTVYGADERLMMFNAAAVAINPHLGPQAIGQTSEALARQFHAGDESVGLPAAGVDNALARFRRKGEKEILPAADGRWIEWSEVGTPSGGTIGLRVDVTDVKKVQQAAEQARAEYEALVDSLSDVVFKGDFGTGTITYVSAAARELFGMAPSSITGRKFFDFTHPEDLDGARQLVRAARQTSGAVQEVKLRMKTADGSVRHVDVRFRLIADGTASGVMRDVSDQIELSAQLKQEMARLRAIVESRGTMISMTDADLNVIMINREYQRFWGVTEDQMIGRNLRDTPVGSGLSPARHRAWLSGASAGPARYIRKRRDAEGRERVSSVTASPVFDELGTLRQVVFLSGDDTERFEAEQALFQSERLATVGEMAATVAHEVAQPLQVIEIARSSAAEELELATETGGPIDVEYIGTRLERIGVQVHRAERIVSDLRAFVRGSRNEAAVPFDVAGAVRNAIGLAQHGLEKAHIALSVAVPGTLPAVLGDTTRLEQVLVNLINNARDAGASAIAVEADTDSQRVRLSVSDNGPGIAPDVLPRLFRQFITTKPRGAGTGLGLRICRRIVEEMGGTITGANRPEGGACFEILLPAA